MQITVTTIILIQTVAILLDHFVAYANLPTLKTVSTALVSFKHMKNIAWRKEGREGGREGGRKKGR